MNATERQAMSTEELFNVMRKQNEICKRMREEFGQNAATRREYISAWEEWDNCLVTLYERGVDPPFPPEIYAASASA